MYRYSIVAVASFFIILFCFLSCACLFLLIIEADSKSNPLLITLTFEGFVNLVCDHLKGCGVLDRKYLPLLLLNREKKKLTFCWLWTRSLHRWSYNPPDVYHNLNYTGQEPEAGERAQYLGQRGMNHGTKRLGSECQLCHLLLLLLSK